MNTEWNRVRSVLDNIDAAPEPEGAASSLQYLDLTSDVRNVLMAALRSSVEQRRSFAVILGISAIAAVSALLLHWGITVLILSGFTAFAALMIILGTREGQQSIYRDLEEGRYCRITGPVRFDEDDGSEWVEVGKRVASWCGGLKEFRRLRDRYKGSILTVDFAPNTHTLIEMSHEGQVIYRHHDCRL